MMFGTDLISKILGGFAVVSISFLAGAWYDHEYGPNAWKLASAKIELDKKNAAIATLNSEDAVTAADEWEKASREDADFSKVSPGLTKCLLDKSQVEALNKIGGG